MPVIRISNSLYKRLEEYVKGFDTPANVIERILDEYEGVNSEKTNKNKNRTTTRPTLIFQPDEETFKTGLIAGNSARVLLHYNDKSVEEKYWHPNQFNEQSNLRANIWSGFLRDWGEKGIVSAEFQMVT